MMKMGIRSVAGIFVDKAVRGGLEGAKPIVIVLVIVIVIVC